MMKPLQVSVFPRVGTQQVGVYPKQSSTVPATTTTTQIDMSAMMSMMLTMMIVVMMMKMMTQAFEGAV